MTQTTEAVQNKTKRGRPRNAEPFKYINLPMPRELHQKMKEQATADTLELTAWIRLICLQELRRRKRAA